MLNRRHAAAQKVAAHLLPTETNLEDTILDNARLQIAIVEARREARVRKSFGAAALVHAADAGHSLANAWASIVQAHIALHEDQRLAGLGAFNYGDLEETPKAAEALEDVTLRAA